MANITIDGKPYTVKDGITIIEAIDQMKVALPLYCYHPGLSIAGNCRICQVEVGKIPRTVIACNTRVTEGMEIMTQSAKAKESQHRARVFARQSSFGLPRLRSGRRVQAPRLLYGIRLV